MRASAELSEALIFVEVGREYCEFSSVEGLSSLQFYGLDSHGMGDHFARLGLSIEREKIGFGA